MKLLYGILYITKQDKMSHFVGQALPRDKIDAKCFPYRAAQWEKNGKVYEKLGIKRWKDYLPDMSKIMPDMVKKKMSAAKEQGTAVLIAETCVAECVHWALIVLSLGIFLFWRGGWAVLFWLVYNILGNVPFIIIQRYNRPRLVMLGERRKRRLAKA